MKKIISYWGRKSWAGEVSQLNAENEQFAVKVRGEVSGICPDWPCNFSRNVACRASLSVVYNSLNLTSSNSLSVKQIL